MRKKRPRLIVDVTLEQDRFLSKLPYGWKKAIFSDLIDGLIEKKKAEGLLSLIKHI